jgi:hypothetical protein
MYFQKCNSTAAFRFRSLSWFWQTNDAPLPIPETMETRESPSLGILDRIVCLHNDNSTTWYHQRQISNISSLRPMKTSMFNACVWIDHILFLQPVVASSPSFVPTRTWPVEGPNWTHAIRGGGNGSVSFNWGPPKTGSNFDRNPANH